MIIARRAVGERVEGAPVVPPLKKSVRRRVGGGFEAVVLLGASLQWAP